MATILFGYIVFGLAALVVPLTVSGYLLGRHFGKDQFARRYRGSLLAYNMTVIVVASVAVLTNGNEFFGPLLAFLICFAPIYVAGLCVKGYKMRLLAQEDHCSNCGYSLKGNITGRCPECGTTVASKIPNPRSKRNRDHVGTA